MSQAGGGPDEGFRGCNMMGDGFFDCRSKFCDAVEDSAAKVLGSKVIFLENADWTLVS
jgi:hypothetical protein